MKADCHCHTLYSDGSLNPSQLLHLAKEVGLQGLSITDHDTVAAFPEAIPLAKELNISLISGIEISAEFQRSSIHVLGYAFDLKYPGLSDFCDQLQQNRLERNQAMLQRLAKINFPISLEELHTRFPLAVIGRPHIAQMLVEKGYVSSLKKAFERYLGDRGRCYAAGFQMSVPDAITFIQQAGGFAVLAHPHTIHPARILPALYDMPFDGIEVHYGRLNAGQEAPWLALAKKKGWLATGGSDFHGDKKAFQPLGCSWTPPEVFERFSARFHEHERITLSF